MIPPFFAGPIPAAAFVILPMPGECFFSVSGFAPYDSCTLVYQSGSANAIVFFCVLRSKFTEGMTNLLFLSRKR